MEEYKKAIKFIAINDEPTWFDVINISGLMSVQLVAYVWKMPVKKVALDVRLARMNEK